jgi:hypothetical protein
MIGRSRSLVTTVAMVVVERKRQRVDLAFQPMQDFAKFLNPGERRLDQRGGLPNAVVNPDNEVLLNLAQRRGDLPVAIDLGLQDPDVPSQLFVKRVRHRLRRILQNSWKFLVIDTVKQAAILLRPQTTPLLMMECDAVALASIADGSDPIDLSETEMRSALPTSNNPIRSRIADIDRTQHRFNRDAMPSCRCPHQLRKVTIPNLLVFQCRHQTNMRTPRVSLRGKRCTHDTGYAWKTKRTSL